MLSGIMMIDQNAFGHDVSNLDEQESLIQISHDVNRQSVTTGQTLIMHGELTAISDIVINTPLSVSLESSKLCTELDVFSIVPQETIGHVSKGDKIPYELKLTLDAGVFHVHPMVNIESYGTVLGPGIIVVVEDSSDSPQTSEFCDERNSFTIILGLILGLVIICIFGYFILRRKKLSNKLE